MKVLVATKNNGKLKEINEYLNKHHVDVCLLSLKDLNDDDDVEENGKSFNENAFIKAKYYYEKYHLPTIGEDSGLEIKHLNNFPGIYSARFLCGLNYDVICDQVLKIMENVKDRECKYHTSICYFDINGKVSYFEGELLGEISYSKKGESGFGYDPIVLLKEYNKTCAEIPDIKSKISHRSQAIEKWVKSL